MTPIRTLPDAPVFSQPPSNTVVGNEGESLQVPLVANANPQAITYTWTKNGNPITGKGSYPPHSIRAQSLTSSTAAKRITSEGPMLNISKLLRTDSGIYTCEATNSQGSARINISVIVECKCLVEGVSCWCSFVSFSRPQMGLRL